jgi:hypothetical protein
VNFIGTIFNDYKHFPNFLMEENPGKLYFMNKILLLSRPIFFFECLKGPVFFATFTFESIGKHSFRSERWMLEASLSRLWVQKVIFVLVISDGRPGTCIWKHPFPICKYFIFNVLNKKKTVPLTFTIFICLSYTFGVFNVDPNFFVDWFSFHDDYFDIFLH